MYLSVNQKYSSFDSQLAREEKNDCFVRSIASAADIAYNVAHSFCKEVFAREDKKGTNNMIIATQMLKAETSGLEIDGKKFDVSVLGKKDVCNMYKLKGDIIWRKKTLKSFVQTHKKGTYLVTVANHALTVKDGEVLDWSSNTFLPTRKVQSAYRLVEKEDSKGVQLSLF